MSARAKAGARDRLDAVGLALLDRGAVAHQPGMGRDSATATFPRVLLAAS